MALCSLGMVPEGLLALTGGQVVTLIEQIGGNTWLVVVHTREADMHTNMRGSYRQLHIFEAKNKSYVVNSYGGS